MTAHDEIEARAITAMIDAAVQQGLRSTEALLRQHGATEKELDAEMAIQRREVEAFRARELQRFGTSSPEFRGADGPSGGGSSAGTAQT